MDKVNMIKCSVELPIKFLALSTVFDFDFVIASSCFEHPEYLDYFLNSRTKRFTMLDNGAFETGEAVDDEQYIELATQLRPDVLVVPDVYKDPLKTVERCINFMNKWQTRDIPDCALMGVLQVNEDIRWIHTLSHIYSHYNIKWIGVPYATGLDRAQLIKQRPEWENVHILGLPHLSEVFALAELPNIKSIDSSLPVKSAKYGYNLLQRMDAHSIRSTAPDFVDIDSSLLNTNLHQFVKICRGEYSIITSG